LAIRYDYDNPDYHAAKGWLFININTVKNWRKYYEIALESYKRAVFDEKDLYTLANYYYQIGGIYFEFGDRFNAVVALSNAIKNDSSKSIYFDSRAFHKQELKNLKGALADYTKAIQLGGSNYKGRGYCRYSLNDFKGAKEDFTIAIKNRELINYNDQEPLYDLYLYRGICNYYLKEFDEACSDYNKASELGSYDAYDYIKRYCN